MVGIERDRDGRDRRFRDRDRDILGNCFGCFPKNSCG